MYSLNYDQITIFHLSNCWKKNSVAITVGLRCFRFVPVFSLGLNTGFLQVFSSKIPWLFQSQNDNFPDIIETIKITLSHKCHEWY